MNENNYINHQQTLLSDKNTFRYAYENFIYKYMEYEIPQDYYNKIIKKNIEAKSKLKEEDFNKYFNEIYKLLFSLINNI